jgi:ribosomal protein S18 acetylase RimI-like enzyme
VFSALPDDPSPASWAALAELTGPGQLALLMRESLEPPDAWRVEFAGTGLQMVWNGDRTALAPVVARAAGLSEPEVEPGPEVEVEPGPEVEVEPGPEVEVEVERLGPGDVADMVELVERTEPGPFTARTHELGTYLGVRRSSDRRLVALAGQRTRPPGHVEISAVCTDPEARGRGLARLLITRLIDEITAAGDVPILHVAGGNQGAIRLYRSMGFEVSREVSYAALSAPARAAPVADQATG